MAVDELNFDPKDIAEALRRNVESYQPSVEREEVGRVVEAGDASLLSLEVAGSPVVSRVRPVGDANGIARGEPHDDPIRSSSSPGARMPFSSRIVSTEKSQRS